MQRRVSIVARFALLLAVARPAASQPAREWCAKLPRPANAALVRVEVSDWYRVYRVTDGVFALAEPEQWQEAIAYLILGTDRALLFDSGIGVVPIRPVVERLTKLPVTVLNSHTHFDHMGGNWEFDRIAAMDTPFTHQSEAGVPHAAIAAEVAPGAFCGASPAGFDTATYHTVAWRATETVRDGTRLALGGRTLEVLHVPGHTPDALALFDRANGLLWTGDSYYDGPIWLFAPETDLAAYERSMARLVALGTAVQRLLPAHNTASADPAALGKTLAAIRAIRAGRAKPRDATAAERVYEVGGITIVTSEAALKKR
ncbi:MAG: MBL fold metallo-hydrolase [Gemmatimonadetes bacterium]|nr:MBL fold metallo-hydrolase [Gemmatimonadota bacterium]